VRHHTDIGVDVPPDLVVDDLLDTRELVGLDRLVMREVEAQSVRRDERALLLHVIAEHAAKRGVQQMRRGVIEPYRLTALPVERRVQLVADADLAALDRADMPVGRAELLRVRDAKLGVLGAQRAGIADLTAAFRVERRAIQHDRAARAARERLDRMPVGVVEGGDFAVKLKCIVAVELGWLEGDTRSTERSLEHCVPLPASGNKTARLARALALRRHLALEARLVDSEPALARDIRGQVDRKAV